MRLLLLVFLLSACTGCQMGERSDIPSTPLLTDTINADTAQAAPVVEYPHPVRQDTLGDGTRLFYLDSISTVSTADFARKRVLQLNGYVFLEVAAGAPACIVHTRLMELRVSASSLVLAQAYQKDAGADFYVLKGTVIVRKNYPSPYSAADTVHANEMFMINRDIDLTEKEAFSSTALKAWWEALR